MIFIPRREQSSFYSQRNGRGRGFDVLRKRDKRSCMANDPTFDDCDYDDNFPVE